MLSTSSSCQNIRQGKKTLRSLYFESEDNPDVICEIGSNDNASSPLVTVSLPLWTADEQYDRHLWYDTATSRDYCYIGDLECLKSGPRKKCAACKIVCHTACIPKLNARCKPTFRQVNSLTYRERNGGQIIVKHHWVLRRRQENRCQACRKWIQTKFTFRDTLYMQCTWCRLCYHNKPECFKSALLSVNCPLGKHSKLIIPPTWILKIPHQEAGDTLFRRSPSNPAFSLAPMSLKPSASVEALRSQPHTSTSSDDITTAMTSSVSSIGLASTNSANFLTPLPLGSPRPCSSATCEFPFVVKPTCRTAACPLIVFINPKAGGNQGVRLIKKFQGILNPRQVFSLSEGGPKFGLELFGRLPNVRILVCGGDGTVGWILSEIDSLGLYPTPPVAILPLGTGNDLARTLQWGPGYADEPLSKVLTAVEEGRVVLLDRWNVQSRPLTQMEPEFDEETEPSSTGIVPDRASSSVGPLLSDKLPLSVMNNYFSLGADAATALEFHESREANPDRFNSRLKNKIFYAGVGGKDLIKRSWRDLSDYVTLSCDGINMKQKLRELRPHVLLFLNIPKYSAGTMPWGHSPGSDQQQRIDDKKIEVIALTTASLATLQMGGHGDRICQCSEVHLVTRKTIPMQIDGEPCRLGPSVIDIQLRNQAFVVQKTRRYEGSSPAYHGVSNASGRMVKIYIIYPDPNGALHSLDHLTRTARHFANLRFGAYSDLSAVRRQIKNACQSTHSKADGITLPNKWIFLDMTAINGQVFGLDPSMESAHFVTDILSNGNELFLISQDGVSEGISGDIASLPSEDISRKSSDSSQLQWDNSLTTEGQLSENLPRMLKSPSVEIERNDVYKKLSFTVHLGKAYSCPEISLLPADYIVTAFQKSSLNTWFMNCGFGDDEESSGSDECNDECTTGSTSTGESRHFGRFARLRNWRRMPPKILISMAMFKRVKESRVGFAPHPVQSLNSLLDVGEPSSPSRGVPEAKVSAASDPGFAPHLRNLIKNNVRSYFLSACHTGNMQCVRNAIDAGYSPLNVDPNTGNSGLHYAAKFGRLNVVQFLIDNGPKELLDLQNNNKKQTALHKAAAGRRRRVCQLLVRAGANAACEDDNGDTPSALALAAGDKKLAQFLQREELLELIRQSNEGNTSIKAKLVTIGNFMTSPPPSP